MLRDLWAYEDPRITVARIRRSEIPPVCAGHFGRRVRRTDGEGPVHRGLQVRERGETESEKRIRKWLGEVEHKVVVIEDDDEDEAEVKMEDVEESDEEVDDDEEENEEEGYEEEEYEGQEKWEEPRPGMMNSGVYYVGKGGELMVM
nr:hypothetical protein B0A51_04338 [Rachicladosporium sp. CCFEE 5018]